VLGCTAPTRRSDHPVTYAGCSTEWGPERLPDPGTRVGPGCGCSLLGRVRVEGVARDRSIPCPAGGHLGGAGPIPRASGHLPGPGRRQAECLFFAVSESRHGHSKGHCAAASWRDAAVFPAGRQWSSGLVNLANITGCKLPAVAGVQTWAFGGSGAVE
jgi:hypothetical protein